MLQEETYKNNQFQASHSYGVEASESRSSDYLFICIIYLPRRPNSDWLWQVMWHKNYWWHHSTLSTRPNDSTSLVTMQISNVRKCVELVFRFKFLLLILKPDPNVQLQLGIQDGSMEKETRTVLVPLLAIRKHIPTYHTTTENKDDIGGKIRRSHIWTYKRNWKVWSPTQHNTPPVNTVHQYRWLSFVQ